MRQLRANPNELLVIHEIKARFDARLIINNPKDEG